MPAPEIINLDYLDTPPGLEGTPVVFRGQTFMITHLNAEQAIQFDQQLDEIRNTGQTKLVVIYQFARFMVPPGYQVPTVEETETAIENPKSRKAVHPGVKRAIELWDLANSQYEDRPGLSMQAIVELLNSILSVARGTWDSDKKRPDPKESA